MTPDQLAAYRRVRDRFFADDVTSPIPEEDRTRFQGLDYYPYNPDAVVEGGFEPADEVREEIEHTGGSRRAYRVAGWVTVDLDDATYRLTVLDGGDGDLFVPIRDATSGRSTYEGGRYVPVTPSGPTVMVDFNLAQNPWCVYDEEFSCPLPPSGNLISKDIEAGERLYHSPMKGD